MRSRALPTNTASGLMYHAHLRPLASPMAALLGLSATLHDYVPRGIPSPSKAIRALGSLGSSHLSSAAESIPPAPASLANTLEIHPMHVEQVARAICESIGNPQIQGVIDSKAMRAILANKRNGEVQQPH
jgi:hypothetical protein